MLGIQLLLLTGIPLILTVLATPVVLRFADAYGLFDMPGQRHIHTKPTPRLGGVAMVLGFLVTMVGAVRLSVLSPPLTRLLAVSVVMFVMGVWDDVRQLRASTRLLIQIGCAIFSVCSCGLALNELVLTPDLSVALPPAIGVALAAFVIVGAINAVNMVDGMDGLAGGVVLICLALLTYLHVQTSGNLQVALFVSMPIVGVLLGFLRYNTHPARIFMGDGGSNWLGYVVGVMMLIVLSRISIDLLPNGRWGFVRGALSGTGGIAPTAQDRSVPFLSVICCLAIPVIDTATVIMARLRHGLSPLVADRRHFHHSLLRLGLTQSQSVGAVYFIALTCGMVGSIPVIFPRIYFPLAPYLVFAVLCVVIPVVMSLNDQVIGRFITRGVRLRKNDRYARPIKMTIRTLERMNRYVVYAILLGMPIFAGRVEQGVGYAAMFALALMVLAQLTGGKRGDFLNSLVFVISAQVLLVANNQKQVLVELNGQVVALNALYNGMFAWLAASTLVIMIMTFRRRYLIFSASDFLIVLLPLALLLVPEPYRSYYFVDIIALKGLILFAAVQLLMRRQSSVSGKIRMVLLNALALVTAMGVFGLRVIY